MWTYALLVFSLGGNRLAVFTLEGNQVERVHCESADQCCHRVLRRQIYELFPVRPAAHLLEECTQPEERLRLAGTGDAVQHETHGLATISGSAILFSHFPNAPLDDASEKNKLFCRGHDLVL